MQSIRMKSNMKFYLRAAKDADAVFAQLANKAYL